MQWHITRKLWYAATEAGSDVTKYTHIDVVGFFWWCYKSMINDWTRRILLSSTRCVHKAQMFDIKSQFHAVFVAFTRQVVLTCSSPLVLRHTKVDDVMRFSKGLSTYCTQSFISTSIFHFLRNSLKISFCHNDKMIWIVWKSHGKIVFTT